MKTQVLALRLPEDQLLVLQKMADSKGLKVSDLVKQMINDSLDEAKTSTDNNNSDVMARLEKMESNILGASSWLADGLITNLKATAGARYLALLATENCDEVISYLANNKPLDSQTKAQWQKNRAEQVALQGEILVQETLAMANESKEG
jgi:hypothetical protein